MVVVTAAVSVVAVAPLKAIKAIISVLTAVTNGFALNQNKKDLFLELMNFLVFLFVVMTAATPDDESDNGDNYDRNDHSDCDSSTTHDTLSSDIQLVISFGRAGREKGKASTMITLAEG